MTRKYPSKDYLSLPKDHREKLRQPVPKKAPEYYQPALLLATDKALSIQRQKGNRQNGIPLGGDAPAASPE